MGMISEIAAKYEADRLKIVLIAALKSRIQENIQFCKLHIYPLYLSACGEAFEIPEKEITDAYGK